MKKKQVSVKKNITIKGEYVTLKIPEKEAIRLNQVLSALKAMNGKEFSFEKALTRQLKDIDSIRYLSYKRK